MKARDIVAEWPKPRTFSILQVWEYPPWKFTCAEAKREWELNRTYHHSQKAMVDRFHERTVLFRLPPAGSTSRVIRCEIAQV